MADGLPRIQLARPWMGAEERQAAMDVLDSGWLTQGPRVREFEGRLAQLAGTRHAIAVSSGTAALHLALWALDLPAGSEVLVPDFTFPATANAALLCGLTPISVDIDPTTFNLDPQAAEAAIGPRTRVVMPVHQFGLMADMDALMGLARRHDLVVIEDAACAVGATSPAGNAGAVGSVGCYSFHPRKIITAGEGGAVTTDDDDLARNVRLRGNHGIDPDGPRLSFSGLGCNLRMPDLLAAVGLAQLDRLDEALQRRVDLAGRYLRRLTGLPGITLPTTPAGHRHTYQTFALLLDGSIDRQIVMQRLADVNIESSIGAHALHRIDHLRSHGPARSYPGSDRAADGTLCLPLHPGMADADVDRVVEALARALDQ
jgi:dTDP-4-amino-4,6-dideoxygalactose transaminase